MQSYVRGWRAVVWGILGLVVLVIAATALLWLTVAVLLLAAVWVLHFVYLPRISTRLGVPPLALDAALLPLAIGVGWLLVGEPLGGVWGALFWLGAIGLPRLALVYVWRHLRTTTTGVRMHVSHSGLQDGAVRAPGAADRAVVGVTCSRCGVVSFAERGVAHVTCPGCGATLPASTSAAPLHRPV